MSFLLALLPLVHVKGALVITNVRSSEHVPLRLCYSITEAGLINSFVVSSFLGYSMYPTTRWTTNYIRPTDSYHIADIGPMGEALTGTTSATYRQFHFLLSTIVG